jgi:hypothetical protein
VLGVAVLGTAVLGVAVLGTAVLHPQTTSPSTQHSSQHAPPSHRASQTMESHRTSRCSREMKIPWCACARRRCAGRRRARDRRAGRRRARDRRAAPTNDITLNTALVPARASLLHSISNHGVASNITALKGYDCLPVLGRVLASSFMREPTACMIWHKHARTPMSEQEWASTSA